MQQNKKPDNGGGGQKMFKIARRHLWTTPVTKKINRLLSQLGFIYTWTIWIKDGLAGCGSLQWSIRSPSKDWSRSSRIRRPTGVSSSHGTSGSTPDSSTASSSRPETLHRSGFESVCAPSRMFGGCRIGIVGLLLGSFRIEHPPAWLSWTFVLYPDKPAVKRQIVANWVLQKNMPILN